MLRKESKTLFKDFYTERVAVDWFYLMKFVWSHEDGGYKEYLEELAAADIELINKKWLGASLDLEDSKE